MTDPKGPNQSLRDVKIHVWKWSWALTSAWAQFWVEKVMTMTVEFASPLDAQPPPHAGLPSAGASTLYASDFSGGPLVQADKYNRESASGNPTLVTLVEC